MNEFVVSSIFTIQFLSTQFHINMSRESTLLSQLETIFQFFRFFGFSDSTGALNLISKIRILAILTFLVFAIYSTIFVEIPRIYRSGYGIHILTHLSNSLAGIMSIIASFVHRKKIAKLLRKLQTVSDLQRQLNVQVNHKLLIDSSLMHIVCCCIIYSIVIGYISFEAMQNVPQIGKFLVYYYTPCIISLVEMHRYRFFIQQIACHACILNNVVCQQQQHQPELSLRRLKVLQKVYHLLYEATMLMNEIFSGHIVVVYGEIYGSAFYRTYLLCENIMQGKTTIRQFIGVAQIIYVLFAVQYDAEICGRMVS